VADPVPPGVPGPVDGEEALRENVPTILSDRALRPALDAYEGVRIEIEEAGMVRSYRVLPADGGDAPPAGWTGKALDWRNARDEIVFPNADLDSDVWGILVTEGGAGFASGPGHPHGNCFGITSGEFADVPSSSPREAMKEAFLKARGLLPGGVGVDAAYAAGERSGAIGPRDLLDFYMERRFGAVPADREDRARYAVYGAHIALRVDAPLGQWLSRASNERPLFVHATAGQLAGGAQGDLLGLYTAPVAPGHVRAVVRP
jgi:hypothetical protein